MSTTLFIGVTKNWCVPAVPFGLVLKRLSPGASFAIFDLDYSL